MHHLDARVCAVILLPLLLLLIWRMKLRSRRVTAHGRAVFVSGCDSGFGLMLATQLFERGFSVFAACLTPKGVKRFNSFSGSREDAAFLQPLLLDITNEGSVARAVEVKRVDTFNPDCH
jgi:11-cis-retinol dehydrogenase